MRRVTDQDPATAGTSMQRALLSEYLYAVREIFPSNLTMPKNPPTTGGDAIPDVENWLTPDEFAAEYPKIAHASAVRRDVWRRKELGLVELGAMSNVGKRVLIHRHRYAAWRLGQLKSPDKKP